MSNPFLVSPDRLPLECAIILEPFKNLTAQATETDDIEQLTAIVFQMKALILPLSLSIDTEESNLIQTQNRIRGKIKRKIELLTTLETLTPPTQTTTLTAPVFNPNPFLPPSQITITHSPTQTTTQSMPASPEPFPQLAQLVPQTPFVPADISGIQLSEVTRLWHEAINPYSDTDLFNEMTQLCGLWFIEWNEALNDDHREELMRIAQPYFESIKKSNTKDAFLEVNQVLAEQLKYISMNRYQEIGNNPYFEQHFQEKVVPLGHSTEVTQAVRDERAGLISKTQLHLAGIKYFQMRSAFLSDKLLHK